MAEYRLIDSPISVMIDEESFRMHRKIWSTATGFAMITFVEYKKLVTGVLSVITINSEGIFILGYNNWKDKYIKGEFND